MTTHLPALKTKTGDWDYYLTHMNFGDIASPSLVKLAGEIVPHPTLEEMIQRELSESGRVVDMTKFLLDNEQRFYGSIVVAMYKGNPHFTSVKISDGHDLVDNISHDIGILTLDGTHTLYALDGQHRVASIREACRINQELKSEQISVIIVDHDDSDAGIQRTRRLFTKLNRHAVPTSRTINICLDEDDHLSINTRRLIRDNHQLSSIIKLLDKRGHPFKGKQLNTSDKDMKFLLTIQGLYECNQNLSKAFKGDSSLRDIPTKIRPDDDVLDLHYSYLNETWKSIFSKLPTFQLYATNSEKLKDSNKIDKSFYQIARSNAIDGGSIWARPIGQLILTEFISQCLLNKLELDEIIKIINKLPEALNNEPWVNIIWDPDTRRIIGTQRDRKFIIRLLLHIFDIKSSLKPEIKKNEGIELASIYGEYHKTKGSKELTSFK